MYFNGLLNFFSAAATLQNISATDASGNQVLLTYSSGSQNNMQSFQLSWKASPKNKIWIKI